MADPKIKLGNDIWATKQESLLAYNDEGGNFKSLPFQVDRLSNGTYYGRNGLIQTAASNEPRIDFTSNTKGGLLLEPQRTNYALYSNDASQWGNVGGSQSITKTQNYSTAPDGTQTAARLQATATGSNYSLIQLSTTSTTGNYAGSVYLKSNTGNTENVIVYGRNTSVTSYPIGNEWQRIEIQGSATSGQNSYLFLGSFPNNGSDESIDILVWGGQLEAGTYASSYIPTSSAVVTKVKDEVENGGNKYIINKSSGTIFLDCKLFQPISDGGRCFQISNASTSNRLVFITNTTTLRFYAATNGSQGQLDSYQSFTYNQRHKIALSYESNSVKIYIDGVLRFTDPSFTTFASDLTRIDFGQYDSTSMAEGEIFDFQYFHEVLSESELLTKTTL